MRVFVKSFGCSTNVADGEVLAGCLAKAGHSLVNSSSEAELIVYNTCAVKGPTEDKTIDVLKRVPKGKKLIVAGCLPLINWERLSSEVQFNGVVGPAAAGGIVEIIKRVAGGERVTALENAEYSMPSLGQPRIRANPIIDIVPISYGCLGSCAYCCVRSARGSLRSYAIDDIVDRVKGDLDSGVREVWLTSQDAACYGRDRNANLAELLKALCSIDQDFKIRVGMMNPNFAIDILDDLIDVFHDERIFKFIHLPVQSGDDETLIRMRRLYSVSDFKKVVEAFRTDTPEMTLSTDVICGFPGESAEAFDNTLRMIEEVKPDIVNVSKFFVRPGTTACEMRKDFVPANEVSGRSRRAADCAKKAAFERNRHWVGLTGDVLVDEVGKTSGSWIGRNFAYKPIVVRDNHKLLGKTLRVKICEAMPSYLVGEIVE